MNVVQKRKLENVKDVKRGDTQWQKRNVAQQDRTRARRERVACAINADVFRTPVPHSKPSEGNGSP